MYLKKTKKERVKTGEFVVLQTPFPNETHPFRFQYSGTAVRTAFRLRLMDVVIDKFDRQGNHVRTTSKHGTVASLVLEDGHDNDTYFVLVTENG